MKGGERHTEEREREKDIVKKQGDTGTEERERDIGRGGSNVLLGIQGPMTIAFG